MSDGDNLCLNCQEVEVQDGYEMCWECAELYFEDE